MQVSIRGVYVNEVKVKWIKIMAINDHNIHFYFYKFVLVVVYERHVAHTQHKKPPISKKKKKSHK